MGFWSRRPIGGNSPHGYFLRRSSPDSLGPEPSVSSGFHSGHAPNGEPSSAESVSPHPEIPSLSDAPSSSDQGLAAQDSGAPTTNTTTAAAVFTKVIRAENYWPKIREAIEKSRVDQGVKGVKLCLDCPICQSTMLRFPTPIFPVRGEERSPSPLDKITVLFCGHVFHNSCIRAWMRVCEKADNHNHIRRTTTTTTTTPPEARQGPSCPNCREPLVYGECGHAMNLKLGSPLAPEDIEARIPRVRDEGGRKPARCADCQLGEIKKTAARMAHLICEPGDKDMRSQGEQGQWRRECEEQLQTTAALMHVQWAKHSNRW